MRRLSRFLSLLAPLLAAPARAAVRASPGDPAVPASIWSGPPFDVSTEGHRITFLFDMTTVIIGILFAIAFVWLLWSFVFFRASRGARARYEHGTDRHAKVLTTVLSAIVFVVLDVNILVNAFRDVHEHFWRYPSGKKVLRVEVMAQQWAWNFRYAGPDGKFNTADDVITLNEMHVPTGTRVMLDLKGKDVIHSFYLPNFRIKQDAVPGVVTKLWFEATKPGRYEIACAQLCGVWHYLMRGLLVVDTPQQYQAWLDDQEQQSARAYVASDTASHWGWDWEQ